MGLFHHFLVYMGDLPTFGPSCTELVYPGCWHFNNGATSKFDDVLLDHGGLPHVLPLAVQLGCGLQHFSVSPRPLGFGVGTKGFGAKDLGPGLDNYITISFKSLRTMNVDYDACSRKLY